MGTGRFANGLTSLAMLRFCFKELVSGPTKEPGGNWETNCWLPHQDCQPPLHNHSELVTSFGPHSTYLILFIKDLGIEMC